MSVILGLDIATVTGFAWYEPGQSLSSIKTGLIKAQGGNAEEKAASLAQQLVTLFKPCRPDFVAIERPLPNVKQFEKYSDDLVDGQVSEATINPNQMLLPTFIGAAVGIIAAYRIPFETIAPQTWHKSYYGSGFKPPRKWIKVQRHPQGGYWKNDWKTPAIERARMLRIDVKNADAAEAVGIAMAGVACQRFKDLRPKVAA